MAAFLELGELAVGTIEAGASQKERLDELTERADSGEFHDEITWSDEFKKMTLVRCVDGRTPAQGMNPLGPNSAGGTESLFVADDLTTKRFGAETTAGGYANAVAFLQDGGYEIGGHTDLRATGNASGCGANDKLANIYDFIAKNGDALREMAARLGVEIPDETQALIIKNAHERTQFSSGRELLAVLQKNARQQFVDKLNGSHKEVITVINTKAGTTLNRDRLKQAFGENYQAFNVDAWALDDAAKIISDTEAEAAQKAVAMTYYNLATAYVLAGPKMRIVTV